MVDTKDNTETVSMFHVEEASGRPRIKIKRKNVILIVAAIITITLTITIEITLLTANCRADIGTGNNVSRVEVEHDDSYTGNNTLCTFLKQFNLSRSKKVSVCAYNGAVRIDFRRFIGEQATIQGISFRVNEFRTLLQLWGKIQMNIATAENHI
jgi:hypothetical protein